MKRRSPWHITRIGAVLCGLIAVLGFTHAPVSAVTPTAMMQTERNAPIALDAVTIVRRAGPAVVTILTAPEKATGNDSPLFDGSGTGFIIDTDGHIVTNAHVVEGGASFVVVFLNGESRSAELIGADPVSDLAVLKVEGDVPAMLEFGDSDAIVQGETVLAFGSPLGMLSNTVTEGIVGGVGRSFPAGFDEPPLVGLIQHDAPINPGNSGGPLIDNSGKVVGVNTLAITLAPGEDVAVQGLFFAIPANRAATIVARLIVEGEVVYPDFGAETIPLTPVLSVQLGLDADVGDAVIRVTPGSPADEAGLRSGDVILAINGTKVDPMHPLIGALPFHRPNETILVSIQRGSQRLLISVTLGSPVS